MDPVLVYTQAHQSGIIDFIRELVECESPSDDSAAVNRFVDLFAAKVADIATVKTLSGGKSFGRHMRVQFKLPGRAGNNEQGQILGLGHSDTVYPLGTL